LGYDAKTAHPSYHHDSHVTAMTYSHKSNSREHLENTSVISNDLLTKWLVALKDAHWCLGGLEEESVSISMNASPLVIGAGICSCSSLRMHFLLERKRQLLRTLIQ
jgi:hypothetical protein